LPGLIRRALVLVLALPLSAAAGTAWDPLAPGLTLGQFTAQRPSPIGGSRITILRIDPGQWELVVIGRSWEGQGESLTARDWAKRHRLVAAINAGMFATDRKTHVGHLSSRGHVNSARPNPYQSVAAFDPRNEDLPQFRLFDLDTPGVSLQGILDDYGSAIQNLRLIKRPGLNRWRPQAKTWSEAALGEDTAGHALFIFCPSPVSMHDLNEALLSLGIGLVAAQHLEGGAQAQLFVHLGDTRLELSGIPKLSSPAGNAASVAWPIPNVLGIRRPDR